MKKYVSLEQIQEVLYVIIHGNVTPKIIIKILIPHSMYSKTQLLHGSFFKPHATLHMISKTKSIAYLIKCLSKS